MKFPNSRSVQRNVLCGVSGTHFPTMQPSSTRYSADPPRFTQPARSRPLKRGSNPSATSAAAACRPQKTSAPRTIAAATCRLMADPP